MKTEWVSVKDELPKMYDKVLVATTFFKEPLITNRFDVGSGKWKWDFSRYVGLHDCTVTHWTPLMPLPEPPTDKIS